jgi:hypothetical protein
MPRHFALFIGLPIILNTGAHAQTQAASPEPPLWDHNGSVMSLVAKGSSREFYYQKPRPGMLEAGAKPGSLLFRGEVSNGQYSGTAFIFSPRCGQIPFQVKGAILDNDERIVLTGQAPRVGRNCQAFASDISNLEFRLSKSASAETPSLDNQETKPELPSIDDETPPSTSTAQPSATHDSPSLAKDQSGNIGRQAPGILTPEPSTKKETVLPDDLDSYVLTGAIIVLIGALLFFFVSPIARKLLWRNRRPY